METICIKMEKSFRYDIETTMKKHHFSTMTEFIREAIRDKMKQLEWESISPQKLVQLELRAKQSLKNLKKKSYSLKDL